MVGWCTFFATQCIKQYSMASVSDMSTKIATVNSLRCSVLLLRDAKLARYTSVCPQFWSYNYNLPITSSSWNLARSKTKRSNFTNFVHMLRVVVARPPPLLTALQYVMFFRFCGFRHVLSFYIMHALAPLCRTHAYNLTTSSTGT